MSLIIFNMVGCASIERPDANLYGVNAAKDRPVAKLRGYNLRRDYNDDGTRKPGAKPIEADLIDVRQLNGWVCTDPISLKNIQVFIQDLRDAYKQCKGAK